MATWRERKLPASWRGVPFHVDGDELSGGRRGQLHEYPQRDRPFVEDLGRKARKFSFTAFLIGPDYMDRRDALLAALEKAGAGTLVHPEYGSVTVSLDPGTDYRISHSREQGGYCTVQMAFVEAGELVFPSARIDTAVTAWDRAGDLDSAAVTAFADTFSLDGWPDFIAEGALSDMTDALDFMETALSLSGLGALASVRSELTALIIDATALAAGVQSLFQAFGAADGGASTLALSAAATYRPGRTLATQTPTGQQEQANQSAIAALVRRAALAQASRAASVTRWTVRDEALAIRESLAARYRDEEDATLSSTVFGALSAARLATVRDIGQRAKPLPRLREITPPGPMPALVLSYDLYETTEREADIVARNRIVHPGFVPRQPLLVTSN